MTSRLRRAARPCSPRPRTAPETWPTRPPNDLTPTALADYATELAGRHDALTVTVLDGEQIRDRGMGAFAAVAQGSDQDPRMIELVYEPEGADTPRLALIGKAVTFDSGGLAIKPANSMIDMKFDMCGGAAVIEAIAALAELEAPVRVLGVVGATENMINGGAVRPGDIITALDGTTIEVDNPDAEGGWCWPTASPTPATRAATRSSTSPP